jgi:hypothetical protein
MADRRVVVRMLRETGGRLSRKDAADAAHRIGCVECRSWMIARPVEQLHEGRSPVAVMRRC